MEVEWEQSVFQALWTTSKLQASLPGKTLQRRHYKSLQPTSASFKQALALLSEELGWQRPAHLSWAAPPSPFLLLLPSHPMVGTTGNSKPEGLHSTLQRCPAHAEGLHSAGSGAQHTLPTPVTFNFPDPELADNSAGAACPTLLVLFTRTPCNLMASPPDDAFPHPHSEKKLSQWKASSGLAPSCSYGEHYSCWLEVSGSSLLALGGPPVPCPHTVEE